MRGLYEVLALYFIVYLFFRLVKAIKDFTDKKL